MGVVEGEVVGEGKNIFGDKTEEKLSDRENVCDNKVEEL